MIGEKTIHNIVLSWIIDFHQNSTNLRNMVFTSQRMQKNSPNTIWQETNPS